ncbi:MAG: FAD-dependent monooxygenase [Gammaproteobacteria bacterium]|nr:FAD-dependent monooxygenase [Gammaproteobacteria bacterium]
MRDECDVKNFDVIIVGGGLVGATLALALNSYRVALLEAQPRHYSDENIPGGERAIVLSASSKNILSALNIWPSISPYVESVNEVKVTDKGYFGQVRMSAKEEELSALGYVVQAKYLQIQLSRLLDEHENITVFYQSKCEELINDDSCARVKFQSPEGEHQISANLVVAADGHYSAVRQLLGIAVNSVDYQQSAIVSNIELARDHKHIAYERFTPTGPIALLPLGEKKSTLVWTVPHSQVNAVMALSQEEFIEKVQAIFGYRLGRFMEATPPVVFPIVMHRATELVRKRIVLIGNAANAIHPIAGQGLNLGLRDVAVLVEILNEQGFSHIEKSLCDYVDRRRADHLQIINITHSLVGFFTNAFFPLTTARNIGMTVMDCVPMAKRWLSKRSLGQVGYISPLSCGVSMHVDE